MRRLVMLEDETYDAIVGAVKQLPDSGVKRSALLALASAVIPRLALFHADMDELCSGELYDTEEEALAACDPEIEDEVLVVEVNVPLDAPRPDFCAQDERDDALVSLRAI